LNKPVNVKLKPIFTAEDIRQYFYCPRIIYFRYVLRARVSETVKMRKGREIHKEKYRSKKIEIDGEKQKYFNVYLLSEEYGLAALIDLLIYDGENIDVVEIKSKKTGNFKFLKHHKMQLVAQAVLAEKELRKNVRKIGVLYDDVDKITWFEINDSDKLEIFETLKKINEIVIYENIPNPAKNTAKCVDCEYKYLCEDAT